MKRHFFSALILLGCLIGPSGCSRSDKGESAPKAAASPAKIEETNQKGAASPAKIEGAKPKETKVPSVTLELKVIDKAPSDSGKTKQ